MPPSRRRGKSTMPFGKRFARSTPSTRTCWMVSMWLSMPRASALMRRARAMSSWAQSVSVANRMGRRRRIGVLSATTLSRQPGILDRSHSIAKSSPIVPNCIRHVDPSPLQLPNENRADAASQFCCRDLPVEEIRNEPKPPGFRRVQEITKRTQDPFRRRSIG